MPIGDIACPSAGIVSCHRDPFLGSSSQVEASRLERVRVVATLVSLLGHFALRYPFRISCLLRPSGLPVSFSGTPVWLDRLRRPAVCRCVNVDLRHPCLPGRRGSYHGAFIVAPEITRTLDSATRPRGFGRGHGAADRGG